MWKSSPDNTGDTLMTVTVSCIVSFSVCVSLCGDIVCHVILIWMSTRMFELAHTQAIMPLCGVMAWGNLQELEPISGTTTADIDERGSGQSGRPSMSSLRRQLPLLIPLTPPLWQLRLLLTVIDQLRGCSVTLVTEWFCSIHYITMNVFVMYLV